MPAEKVSSLSTMLSLPNMKPINPQEAIQTPIIAVAPAEIISSAVPWPISAGESTNTKGMT